MEKMFLQYLLYTTFIELRSKAYESGDKRSFWLCDILHNVPLYINSEEEVDETYRRLLEEVENLGINNWLSAKREEFENRYTKT